MGVDCAKGWLGMTSPIQLNDWLKQFPLSLLSSYYSSESIFIPLHAIFVCFVIIFLLFYGCALILPSPLSAQNEGSYVILLWKRHSNDDLSYVKKEET